jgi:serine/threonine-protein kinase
MTPERWQRIGELFEAAGRIDPASREAWLQAACKGDDELRAEVSHLLAQDERANRIGFLTPPEATGAAPDRTASWFPRGETDRPGAGQPAAPGTGGPAPPGFTPRQAIAQEVGRNSISEPPDVVRARLRELPIVYFLILTGAALWRRAVIGQEDITLYRLDALVVVALVGIIGLLWSRLPIPLVGLKALELGMIAMLAGRLAYVQYRLMLEFSERGDKMLAQLTLKNIVLLTAVLILTYGLYVPKSWRRAAVVTGPLALLPFAILALLALRHPGPMSWLREGWIYSTTPRALLFTFDALILIILAIGASFGARTISRLRRQVAEARQLGQYHLRRQIGAGGMGEVYLAEHLLLKRPCAVKLIRPGGATDPKALARFEREVRLTATLSHPNTVEIYDYGRAEDGTYYYVMEYLNGLSLAELVERHGPLPPGRVVFLLRQICGALREAHAACLIHRDIKPSNIFASRQGGMGDVAKLLDFGLVLPGARCSTPDLSGEGQILGTPLYMAPEQATGGREQNARTDIYALGAVAYFLITGRPPFDGKSQIEVLVAHARDPVVPPSQIQPGIPDDLEGVVLRCLAKVPAERYEDAASLERALVECACAEDWDQEHADQWWQDADLRAPSAPTARLASVAGTHDRPRREVRWM